MEGVPIERLGYLRRDAPLQARPLTSSVVGDLGRRNSRRGTDEASFAQEEEDPLLTTQSVFHDPREARWRQRSRPGARGRRLVGGSDVGNKNGGGGTQQPPFSPNRRSRRIATPASRGSHGGGTERGPRLSPIRTPPSPAGGLFAKCSSASHVVVAARSVLRRSPGDSSLHPLESPSKRGGEPRMLRPTRGSRRFKPTPPDSIRGEGLAWTDSWLTDSPMQSTWTASEAASEDAGASVSRWEAAVYSAGVALAGQLASVGLSEWVQQGLWATPPSTETTTTTTRITARDNHQQRQGSDSPPPQQHPWASCQWGATTTTGDDSIRKGGGARATSAWGVVVCERPIPWPGTAGRVHAWTLPVNAVPQSPPIAQLLRHWEEVAVGPGSPEASHAAIAHLGAVWVAMVRCIARKARVCDGKSVALRSLRQQVASLGQRLRALVTETLPVHDDASAHSAPTSPTRSTRTQRRALLVTASSPDPRTSESAPTTDSLRVWSAALSAASDVMHVWLDETPPPPRLEWAGGVLPWAAVLRAVAGWARSISVDQASRLQRDFQLESVTVRTLVCLCKAMARWKSWWARETLLQMRDTYAAMVKLGSPHWEVPEWDTLHIWMAIAVECGGGGGEGGEPRGMFHRDEESKQEGFVGSVDALLERAMEGAWRMCGASENESIPSWEAVLVWLRESDEAAYLMRATQNSQQGMQLMWRSRWAWYLRTILRPAIVSSETNHPTGSSDAATDPHDIVADEWLPKRQAWLLDSVECCREGSSADSVGVRLLVALRLMLWLGGSLRGGEILWGHPVPTTREGGTVVAQVRACLVDALGVAGTNRLQCVEDDDATAVWLRLWVSMWLQVATGEPSTGAEKVAAWARQWQVEPAIWNAQAVEAQWREEVLSHERNGTMDATDATQGRDAATDDDVVVGAPVSQCGLLRISLALVVRLCATRKVGSTVWRVLFAWACGGLVSQDPGAAELPEADWVSLALRIRWLPRSEIQMQEWIDAIQRLIQRS